MDSCFRPLLSNTVVTSFMRLFKCTLIKLNKLREMFALVTFQVLNSPMSWWLLSMEQYCYRTFLSSQRSTGQVRSGMWIDKTILLLQQSRKALKLKRPRFEFCFCHLQPL